MGDPAPPPAPIVVDLAAARCPADDPALEAEARRLTPRPPADAVDAKGRPAMPEARLQTWIDSLEVAERRKNGALFRAIEDLRRCRGETPATGRQPAV